MEPDNLDPQAVQDAYEHWLLAIVRCYSGKCLSPESREGVLLALLSNACSIAAGRSGIVYQSDADLEAVLAGARRGIDEAISQIISEREARHMRHTT